MRTAKPRWLVFMMGATLALIAFDKPGLVAQQSKGEDARTKRIAVVLKYGTAKEMAELLTKHFKGAGEIQFLADAGTNMLLVNGTPAVVDEALATLAKLDRRPQLVSVEILLLDVAPKKGADGKLVPGDIDDKQLSGPAAKVFAYAQSLQKSGVLEATRRYSLTALENQPTRVLNGETKPYVVGVNKVGGKTLRNLIYRDTGTLVQLTPRLDAGGGVVVELKVEDSRMIQPADGISLGLDDNGQPILAPEFPITSVNAKVSVPGGQAVLVEGAETKTKSGGARTLIVVSAKLMP